MNVQKHKSFRDAVNGDRKLSNGSAAKRNDKQSAKAGKSGKMSGKEYEKKLEKLQVELCLLQDWVRETGARIVIVFEGRDTAGKGGLIRRLTERVSPRTFRIVALLVLLVSLAGPLGSGSGAGRWTLLAMHTTVGAALIVGLPARRAC